LISIDKFLLTNTSRVKSFMIRVGQKQISLLLRLPFLLTSTYHVGSFMIRVGQKQIPLLLRLPFFLTSTYHVGSFMIRVGQKQIPLFLRLPFLLTNTYQVLQPLRRHCLIRFLGPASIIFGSTIDGPPARGTPPAVIMLAALDLLLLLVKI